MALSHQLSASESHNAPIPRPAIPQPLALSAEAIAWLEAAGLDKAPRKKRPSRLLDLLIGPVGLRLEERSLLTPTATEAFDRRQANCVGIAFLFVSMARQAGIPAFFVLIKENGTATANAGLRVYEDHLAAGVDVDGKLTLFDFGGEVPAASVRFRLLDDLEATAIFVSNQGTEALLDGRLHDAEAQLELATELDPQLAAAWANLGVALRYLDDQLGAEAAYRRALAIEPASISAHDNLAILLEAGARHAEASELRRRSHQLRASSPFALLDLAGARLEAGDLGEARRLYARALQLSR